MPELRTPVVLLVFNRPRTTRAVFDAIAQARPAHLLVVADGPRNNVPGEDERCRQVRDICCQISWRCRLDTNFADINLGCRNRVASGLDWVFANVDEAIILEDDCLPDASFFPYCQELLKEYRGDSRISMISGSNLIDKRIETDASYFLSQFSLIWGWATWRTAWQRYDARLSSWPEVKKSGLLQEILVTRPAVTYWSRIFDRMYENTGPDTWDYQWTYTNFVSNALSIVPRTNLITNIGFGPDATHTRQAAAGLVREAGRIAFPLKHPPAVIPMRSADRQLQTTVFQPGLKRRFASKWRSLGSKLAAPGRQRREESSPSPAIS